ncbi:cache domain-containing protein [Sulfurospirillum sp. T05]|uniref:histidine kinase n=1 Tax=Sulfurospirillum tamanense TaxID=2813362 RepID=A0ABS2WSY8_9BACT|nr:cache domain-containing protein [Sulfurospirillum tamanensis]MBN2964493.1 cache domain-containing protein [Sulfurospirillum tamanensis]
MITERTLPRLITLTPIVTILAFASVMIYGIITSQYETFARESALLEAEYIETQKQLLKEENDKIHAYIAYHRGLLQEEDSAKVKAQIIGWMESVRYGVDGYIWVHDTTHHLVAHPFRQESIGIDDTNNTDATGALIFRSFIDTAQTFPEGGFVEYYWARPGVETPAKKIGFLKLEPQYGWVIGTGVYVDDIVEELAKRKSQMEAQTDAYVQVVLLTAIFLTVVFGMISYVISRAMVRVLDVYKESVALKEHSLTQLNASLSLRIEAALEEAKAKDQALLHQSRLAQMGEMMSLIAHQWRQPLSEVLGIFMELETAAKFGKADQRYIENEAKEGDRLIRYMSQTIDDFRNFFKPETTKERFCIVAACQEALTLAHASLKHQNIEVIFKAQKEVWAMGYPSAYAQVVLNLIQNAKDAHLHQGTPFPWIEIEVLNEGEEVCVRLSDNAGGIDEEVLEGLFEPYVTTKKGSGTGLGLYMAKMIMEKHLGGKIEANNSALGAVFILRMSREG